MPEDGDPLLAGPDVPQFDRPVAGGAGKGPAVRAEADGTDLVGVSPERGALPAAPRVPQFHRLVRGGAGQGLAIRAEDHRTDGIRMPLEGASVALAPAVVEAPGEVAQLHRTAFLAEKQGPRLVRLAAKEGLDPVELGVEEPVLRQPLLFLGPVLLRLRVLPLLLLLNRLL